MARPLRIQIAGLSYHVYARGNGRMDIYLDDCDRQTFLELLAEVVAAFDITCHAYCLMRNHYHLVITTGDANLSKAIHNLNGAYGQWWNRRHKRVGHVFQGRFGTKIVQDDVHLLTVAKYVLLNPVRKELVASADEWRWSSHRATAGLEPVPPFLHPEALWGLLGDGDRETKVLRYRTFMATPSDDAEKLFKVGVIGGREFVERLEESVRRASRDVPRRERRTQPLLESFFADAVTRSRRNAAVVKAHVAGYSVREISAYLRVHRTTVLKIFAAAGRGQVKKATVSGLTPIG